MNTSPINRLRVDELLSTLGSAADPAADIQIDVVSALERTLSRLPQVPWYVSLAHNLRPRSIAFGIHAVAFSLLVFGAADPGVQQSIREHVDLIDPVVRPWVPESHHGGGGGGAREELPESKGRLPKPAPKQFVPPMITDRTPLLAMNPTIVAPPDAPLPQSNLTNWGDPLAGALTYSNGRGSGGGIGDGSGSSVGNGVGVGYGPGSYGGYGDQVFNPGGSVSAPIPIYKPDPDYSEEARKTHFGGMVTVAIVVDPTGNVRDPRVVKSLGMGLDEKALEAVAKWKFKPGMKDGRPVAVRAQIYVTFRLL